MNEGKIGSLNLVNQVKAEKLVRSPGFYKSIIFDALTVVSALAAGYTFSGYLNMGASLTPMLVALGVFSVFASLQVLFMKNLGRRFLVMFLEISAFLLNFYLYDLRLIGAAAAVIFLFYLWGTVAGHGELQNGLKLKFFKVLRPFFAKFVTAFALVFVILYLQHWDQNSVFVSKNTFMAFFDWAANVTSNLYPEVKVNSSFNDFGESLTRFQLKSDPTFKALSDAEQKSVVVQTAKQAIAAMTQRLGVHISTGEKVGPVVYDFLVKTLNDWKDQFQSLFTLAWMFAAFMLIRGAGSVFSLIASILSFIVYQIFLASDFVHLASEPMTKESVGF